MSYSTDARVIKSRFNQAKRKGLPLWAQRFVEWQLDEAHYRWRRSLSFKSRESRDRYYTQAQTIQGSVLSFLAMVHSDPWPEPSPATRSYDAQD